MRQTGNLDLERDYDYHSPESKWYNPGPKYQGGGLYPQNVPAPKPISRVVTLH